MSDSIKNKIAALLTKAESTDNAFEAETFMAKVNELLEKHQIDMNEIRQRAANGADVDPMGVQKGETNLYASMTWAREVAGALAQYYGGRLVYWRRGNHTVYEINGRESVRTTFELMLPFVISQVRIKAKVLIANGYTKSQAERQVGHALASRIWRLVRSTNARRFELSSQALVPVDDMDAWMEAQNPDVKTNKAKLQFGAEAQAQAAKVSLHHQATGKHTKLLEA